MNTRHLVRHVHSTLRQATETLAFARDIQSALARLDSHRLLWPRYY
jgi:hypothetical protein